MATKFKIHEQITGEKTCNLEITEGRYKGVVFKIGDIEIPETPEGVEEATNEDGSIRATINFEVISAPKKFKKTNKEMEEIPDLQETITGIVQDIINDWAKTLEKEEKKK